MWIDSRGNLNTYSRAIETRSETGFYKREICAWTRNTLFLAAVYLWCNKSEALTSLLHLHWAAGNKNTPLNMELLAENNINNPPDIQNTFFILPCLLNIMPIFPKPLNRKHKTVLWGRTYITSSLVGAFFFFWRNMTIDDSF